MKIRLRTLFALTAVFAVLSLWLGTRRIALYPSTLAQVVPVAPSIGGTYIKGQAIEEDFYSTFVNNVALSGDASISTCAEAYLRETIVLNMTTKDGNVSLVTLSAMGNPMVSDRSRIKKLYEIALRSLTDGGMSQNARIKLLNFPFL